MERDLSERRDLTALVLVFPCDDGSFDVLPFFWLPEDGLQDKADQDRVPYPVWQAQGHLETTPGRSINYNFVVHRLAELSQAYNIREVVYDRWHIDRLTQAMSEIGLDLELAPFGQGFRDMSPAVDVLEACVINGLLRTGGHPVLTMCALNAVVDQDPAGNRKLAKDKSSGRIDGAVALAMALRRANEHMDDNPAIILPENYEVTVV